MKAQFKEYRETLQQDMKSNLHDIRKDALMKMVPCAAVAAHPPLSLTQICAFTQHPSTVCIYASRPFGHIHVKLAAGGIQ